MKTFLEVFLLKLKSSMRLLGRWYWRNIDDLARAERKDQPIVTFLKAGKKMRTTYFDGPLRQTWGLILQRPEEDMAYVFRLDKPQTLRVHTFGCLDSLDVYYYDEDSELICEDLGVRPNTYLKPVHDVCVLIETKARGKYY